MKNIAVKIAVIESESGWGRKVDDHMVCLTHEDALKFRDEFNKDNISLRTPDWYMQVEGDPVKIDLNNYQMQELKERKRIWLSELKDIKGERKCVGFILQKEYPGCKRKVGDFEPYTTGEFLQYPEIWLPVYHNIDKSPIEIVTDSIESELNLK